MQLSKDILESLISNTRLDQKGKNLYGDCPYCGENEFGISLGKNHLFRCFRGNECGETGNIFKLLKDLGKNDILKNSGFYSHRDYRIDKLTKYDFDSNVLDEELDSIPTVTAPSFWKRVKDNKYLKSRGFTKYQFDKYEIGEVQILKKYRDYVTFIIRQGGEIKGHVSRSTLSKKEIDHKNNEIKEWNKSNDDKKPVVLRYINSVDTDFSYLLYGVDEVKKGVTETLILVEGLFDKINLEIICPELFLDGKTVCCCTWGKKVSDYQKRLILDIGIKSLLLLYDPDAIEDSKIYSIELMKFVDNVKVGFLLDKDPGDLNKNEFLDVLANLYDPYQFNWDKLQKRHL